MLSLKNTRLLLGVFLTLMFQLSAYSLSWNFFPVLCQYLMFFKSASCHFDYQSFVLYLRLILLDSTLGFLLAHMWSSLLPFSLDTMCISVIVSEMAAALHNNHILPISVFIKLTLMPHLFSSYWSLFMLLRQAKELFQGTQYWETSNDTCFGEQWM